MPELFASFEQSVIHAFVDVVHRDFKLNGSKVWINYSFKCRRQAQNFFFGLAVDAVVKHCKLRGWYFIELAAEQEMIPVRA